MIKKFIIIGSLASTYLFAQNSFMLVDAKKINRLYWQDQADNKNSVVVS